MTSQSRDAVEELRELVLALSRVIHRMDQESAANDGTPGQAPASAPASAPPSFLLSRRANWTEHYAITGGSPLPEPRMVRRIIHQRQLRSRFLPGELFADPAWDMLLDLTAATAEDQRVSVTSLCIASGVPATTALRWIAQMRDAGLVQRLEDHTDKRRVFIALTERAIGSLARYFRAIGPGAGTPV